MSKVLSALSAGCDSALSRSGWDPLHLVQPGEPMWRPSLKRALLLKPLLIARTLTSGILITVTFFSKKVMVLLMFRRSARSAGRRSELRTQRPARS